MTTIGDGDIGTIIGTAAIGDGVGILGMVPDGDLAGTIGMVRIGVSVGDGAGTLGIIGMVRVGAVIMATITGEAITMEEDAVQIIHPIKAIA